MGPTVGFPLRLTWVSAELPGIAKAVIVLAKKSTSGAKVENRILAGQSASRRKPIFSAVYISRKNVYKMLDGF